MFSTVFTRARHLSLFWTRSIQFMPPHPTSWRYIFILPSHLRLDRLLGLLNKKPTSIYNKIINFNKRFWILSYFYLLLTNLLTYCNFTPILIFWLWMPQENRKKRSYFTWNLSLYVACWCINLLKNTACVMRQQFKLSNPTGHVMLQQFNIQQLYVLPTLYLCVLYLSENKQRLAPLTA